MRGRRSRDFDVEIANRAYAGRLCRLEGPCSALKNTYSTPNSRKLVKCPRPIQKHTLGIKNFLARAQNCVQQPMQINKCAVSYFDINFEHVKRKLDSLSLLSTFIIRYYIFFFIDKIHNIKV